VDDALGINRKDMSKCQNDMDAIQGIC
jgi:hypothetical protein